MKLVTIKEVSEFLKVKESTLYSWVHYDSIPFYKLNGLLRFNMEEIMEWVRKSKRTPYNTNMPLRESKNLDIDDIIKKAIDGVKGKGYNPSKRETSPSQGLRKEE